MNLLTVIVNYRTAELVQNGLEALLPELDAIDPQPGATPVTIVDNDSGDDSVTRLREYVSARGWQQRVQVVPSGHNGGFAFGNNVGIRPALQQPNPPDYVFLLNPDAIPDPGCLRTLVDFLEAHPEAGMAGPRIHDGDGVGQTAAFRFPSAVSELENGARLGLLSRLLSDHIVAPPPPPRATTRADWLSGASVLIRRQVFETVGLFDETFFLYFEETDLCRRARNAGWAMYYVPEAGVRHAASTATGLSDRKRRTPPYWYASRRHYFRKHHGDRYLWLANLAYTVGFSSWRLRRRLQRKPDEDRPHALWDFVRHNLVPPERAQQK